MKFTLALKNVGPNYDRSKIFGKNGNDIDVNFP